MNRVALRHDAHWVPTSHGVRVRTADGTTAIGGDSIAGWIEALSPTLDGRRSETEVLASLPEQQRATAARVLAALRARGILRTVAVSAAPDSLGEAALLDYYLRDPADAGERLRTTPVTVVGDGALREPLLQALRVAGLHTARPVENDEPGGGLGDARVVVHIADASRVVEHLEIETFCASSGALLAAAVAESRAVWLRPAAPVDRTRGGLLEGWYRHTALRGPAGDPPAQSLVHRVAAAQLVRDLVGALAGLPAAPGSDTDGRLLRIDAGTLATSTHRVIAPATVADRRRPEPDVGADETDDDRFTRGLAELQDDQIGAFSSGEDHGFAQEPLRIVGHLVGDPPGLLGAHRLVTGAGPDIGQAHHRAARRAVAVHALAVADPLKMRTADGGPLTDCDPAAALASLLRRDVQGFVPGLDLVSAAPVLVPASRVFPALGARSPGPAAAPTRDQAIQDAVMTQCRHLLSRTPIGGPFRPIDLPGAPLDLYGARYLAMAGALGAVRALDLTLALGVPAVWCAAGEHAAVGVGRSMTAALTDALETVLLAHQAAVHHQPHYAPQLVSVTPDGAGTPTPIHRPVLSTDDMIDALARRGWRSACVDLDHDPGVSAAIPHLVSVVLDHG